MPAVDRLAMLAGHLAKPVAAAAVTAGAYGYFVRRQSWEYPDIEHAPEHVERFRELLEAHMQDLRDRNLPPSGLTPAQVEFYRKNGFLVVPNFIPAELAQALNDATEGLQDYTFHWNLFEDYTFKTYCNWIDSQIIREWYENGPLKHVGKDCLESLLGEIAALPAGVTREAIRSQEEHVAMTGETAPVETDYIHKIKRGEEQLKERISEDWPTLSRSLRMKDEKTFREHYGYLYELFKSLQDEKIADVSATEVDKAPFEKLDLPGCRMLNELILGVVGDNDGIAFHWDRGSYSHLHHEEDAVSTWVQLSEEGPGMSMLRQRDMSTESWNNGLQGQNLEPGSDEAKAETERAAIPCPTSQGSLIIFDRKEIHRTTAINRDYDAPLDRRTVSVARWIRPDAQLAGTGKDVPAYAFPNTMQAYMLGARNYFMRPKGGNILQPTKSVYKHAAKKVDNAPLPQVDEPDVASHLFPDLFHEGLPHDQVQIDYTMQELWKDFPKYYSSEFMQKWNSGKLSTPGRWAKLIKEFPLHSRFD